MSGVRPRIGSLFSGVEGFGMGLEAAGFEVAWQVEIDKDAVSVLERHYPNVRRYRDVTEVNGAELEPVDVLVGGFPCQDLSVAGARRGLAGARSGLFFEVARIAAETTTPWLLLENVPGLLSSFTPVEPAPRDVPPGTEWTVEETADLGVVLSTLAEHGYGFATRVLDAQHLGVPQRRERVFIVGCLGDTGERAGSVLLEPESVLRDLASCLAAREGSPGLPESGAGGGGVAGTLAASGAGSQRPAGQGNELDFLVAGTLSPGAHPGGLNGQDAYSGHLIANALNTQQRGVGDPTAETFIVAGTLGATDLTGNANEASFLVAAPLTAGGHPGSNAPGRHREDDENLVVSAIAQNQRGEVRESDVVSALGQGGGKPGQGYPAVAFHATQSPVNGHVSPALGASSQIGVADLGVIQGGCQQDQFIHPDGIAPTLAHASNTHGGNHQPKVMMPNAAVRRLMPVECERLMGWADGWTERRADGSLIPDGPRYRMIGNGVVSNVSAWIGRRLMAALT